MLIVATGVYTPAIDLAETNRVHEVYCKIGNRKAILHASQIANANSWRITGRVVFRRKTIYWIKIYAITDQGTFVIRRDIVINLAPYSEIPSSPLIASAIISMPCHPRQADDWQQRAWKIFSEQRKDFSEADLRAKINTFRYNPLLSIIMPVFNTPGRWLELALKSVQSQLYSNWELCIVDDCSFNEEPRRILSDYAKSDSRIRVHLASQNGGISSASNRALKMASGQYVVLLDHDDELLPDSLLWIVNEINEHPDADFIYTDECKVDDSDKRELFDFFFKPDWSPEMLFNCMYTGHLTAYKKNLVEKVGGFRSKYDFSQDYDLALRASEKAICIRHVAKILYLWRAVEGSGANGGKDFARISNLGALADAMARRNIPATVIAERFNYPKIHISGKDRISIIIPTDSYANLKKSINKILCTTSYSNYEIIAVCNSSLADDIQGEYSYNNRIRTSRYDKPFNFSDKCNQGAHDAIGDILVFLNDDVYPTDSGWLGTLIEFIHIPGVGGISPKLLYENGTIQYAGMITGVPGFVGTACHTFSNDDGHPFIYLQHWIRNVSVLSGACFAIKKKIFSEIGGFDSLNTPNGHSDVDISFKLIQGGYRCVYTPYSVLVHVGNHSWEVKSGKDKADIFLLKKWGPFLSDDPYFNKYTKKLLYRDFDWEYRIIPQPSKPPKKQLNILLVTHQLSLTGAPRLVMLAAIEILASGNFPVVVSPEDGPIRKEFENAGITVIVDATVFRQHWLFARFAKNFDLLIPSTLLSYPLITQMHKHAIPILWWIHEGPHAVECLKGELPGIREALELAKVVYVHNVEYADPVLKGISPKVKLQELKYGLPDDPISHDKKRPHDYITFLIIGSVEPRKGHDIFVKAIRDIPKQLRKLARFKIIGGRFSFDSLAAFYDELDALSQPIPEIIHTGQIPVTDVESEILEADAVVAPSRDDIGPLTLIQGMRHSKICISSDRTGVSNSITHGINGFVFRNENVDELRQILTNVIENNNQLHDIGVNARITYEREFSLKGFGSHLSSTINRLISGRN
ncbi:glycosyltransferase [Termitidicoccus mucosus]|uniref:glycosyltransferase n=1 Tax=Termitidicoccus mucosus TaxID=1184151 RepID=UPI003183A40C